MGNPAFTAILPRPDTAPAIAALVLSSETAAVYLLRRLDVEERRPGNMIAISRDEAREHADRLLQLVLIARQYHAHMTQGRRLETPVDPAFQPATLTERIRAAWQRFVRANLVAEAPLNG